MGNDEGLTPIKEGNSDYVRWQQALAIQQLLSQDRGLATQIYAWLKTQGLKLTDF